jgi:hypothetical protein
MFFNNRYNDLLQSRRIEDSNLKAIMNINLVAFKSKLNRQDFNFGESAKKYDEILHHPENLTQD